jgi:hypothetical protein
MKRGFLFRSWTWGWQCVRQRALRCGLVCGLTLGFVLLGLFGAATRVPDFYARQLAVSRQSASISGEQMQQKVDQFQSDVSQPGTWQVEFTEDQINAWLATQLLARLPRSIPPHVTEPRLAIEANLAKLGAQYCKGNLSTVLSLDFIPVVAGRDNRLAVRIQAARIGAVPGLAERATEAISMAARCCRIDLAWEKEPDGTLVGHFQFDRQLLDLDCPLELRQIELSDGRVRIQGETLATIATRDTPINQAEEVIIQR